MPRPRAHAPNTQGGKPAGQDTSSYNMHSEDLSHPVQNIATSILPLKDFTWIRVVEQQWVKNRPVEQLALRGKTPNQLYLQSGLSIKARGLGFSSAYKGIAGSQWNSQAISCELAAYFSLEILQFLGTNNIIYICKTGNETTKGSKLLIGKKE